MYDVICLAYSTAPASVRWYPSSWSMLIFSLCLSLMCVYISSIVVFTVFLNASVIWCCNLSGEASWYGM